jgi:hypothetical protein
MKALIKVVVLSVAVISISANSKDNNKIDSAPIIFQIIGDNSVIVNGVETTIKGSWQEAMNHVSPDKNNYYKIDNKNIYIQQTSDIKEYMATVTKTSGVDVEFVK